MGGSAPPAADETSEGAMLLASLNPRGMQRYILGC
jgi:hypothetical protein